MTIVAESLLLPTDAVFGLTAKRRGPIRAADFEGWPQEADNPVELVEGWVLPMTPGTFRTGEAITDLAAVLRPLVKERGWRLSLDARHRLPSPPDTVVFPDLVIHCAAEVSFVAGSETVDRVPELVVELLGPETAPRDLPPRGAKFLAYQLAGVAEYYCCWPDGREPLGFHRQGDAFVPLAADADGFFASPLLGARLRLVEATLER